MYTHAYVLNWITKLDIILTDRTIFGSFSSLTAIVYKMEGMCSSASVATVVIICFHLSFTCHVEGIPTLVSESEVEVTVTDGKPRLSLVLPNHDQSEGDGGGSIATYDASTGAKRTILKQER